MKDLPANSWWHRREELEAFAKAFDKSTRLRLKRSWIWNVGALKIFATTVGRTVYIPDDWSFESVMRVIPHEVSGHVKQFRYCGLGIHPSLGIFPGMFFLYLWGVIFPVFLAWGRYRCELHAESKAWKYHLTRGNMVEKEVQIRAVGFGRTVSGPAYGYSFPRFWVVWGFKRRADKVILKARKSRD